MFEIQNLRDAQSHLLQKSVVIFDMDDTLYSETDYVRSGYEQIAKHFPEIDNMAVKLWDAFEGGKQAINYVLEQEGLLSEIAVQQALHIYRYQQPQISLYPEAEQLLEALKSRGIRLGMITDGRPEGQRAKIASLGIEKYFDKIIITDELGGVSMRKPNPVAFELMQAHFNVPYSEMVYIGDNPKKDFIAPAALGMDCIYFRNSAGLYSTKVSV